MTGKTTTRHGLVERRLASALTLSSSRSTTTTSIPVSSAQEEASLDDVLPPPPPILRVPASVMQRCVLPHVDARGLCALQTTCRELRDEISAESLWKERLMRDFPSYFVGVGCGGHGGGGDSSYLYHVDGHRRRRRALYPARWSAQRAYGLVAEGPSKWVKHAMHERFTTASFYHAVHGGGGGGNKHIKNGAGGGGGGTPALCLHSHEGTLVAGFADGYIRMYERRSGDDGGGDDNYDDDWEESEHGGRGGGGGGGGETAKEGTMSTKVGWYLREPCPTRAAHMGGMVTCMDSCHGRLVSAGSDATVAVFDSDTGVELERRSTASAVLGGGTATRGINRVCVERITGGAGVAAADAGDDGAANLYDTATWEIVSSLVGHVGAVYALCWLGPGAGTLETLGGGGWGNAGCLLTGGFDGSMKVWDVRTGGGSHAQELPRVGGGGGGSGGSGFRVYDVCSDPHSPLLFSAHGDFSVRVWDARTWRQLGPALRGHTRWAERLAVSADGATLVSAAADNTARIWDIRAFATAAAADTGSAEGSGGGDDTINSVGGVSVGQSASVGTLRHHTSTVWDACFHGLDSLVTCGSDGTIQGLTLAPPGRRRTGSSSSSSSSGLGGSLRQVNHNSNIKKRTPLPGFSWDQGSSGAKHKAALLAHAGHNFRFANE